MWAFEMLNALTILAFSAALLWAAVSDIRRYLIPNTACLAIVALYAAFVFTSPVSVDWSGALMVAGIALVVGFVMFVLKILGAGDVKLFASAALWAGPVLALPYGVITALAGGLLSAVILVRSRLAPAPSFGGSFQRTRRKVGLPYGVAIVAGGLFVAARLFISSVPLVG